MSPTVLRVAEALVWWWRAKKAWLPTILTGLSYILLAIWGSFGENVWSTGVFVFGWAVFLFIISVLAQIFLQRPTYMELSADTEAAVEKSKSKFAAVEKSLEILLRNLAEDCNFNGNADRASVYYFHEEQFVLLARWSPDPTLAKKGRLRYPIGEGTIGLAWKGGEVVTDFAPSTRAVWNQKLLKTHGFPKDTASALTMQCNRIAAMRVQNEHRPVGVIVFESMEASHVPLDLLTRVADSKLYATLSELVGINASMTDHVEDINRNQGTKLSGSESAPRTWKPNQTRSP